MQNIRIFPTDKRVASRTAYEGDTGTDIGCPVNTPVFAVSDASVIYAEEGHTEWTTPPDTAYSVKLRLDKPIKRNGQIYPYVFYTHLSSVETLSRKVKAGQRVGMSGIGNQVPHLHISFSRDLEVNQYIESLDGQDMMWDEWPQLSREDDNMLSFVEKTYEEKGLHKYAGLWTGPNHAGLDGYRGDVWLDLNVLKNQSLTRVKFHLIKPNGQKVTRTRELRDGNSTGVLLNQYLEGPFRLVITTSNDEPFESSVKQFFVRG